MSNFASGERRQKHQNRPKVELHRHLECSIRFSTLKELAGRAGLPVAVTEKEMKKAWLVTEPMTDLNAVLQKFLVTQRVLSSEEILTRITREAVEDAVNENIRILELRYSPTYVRVGHPQMSFAQIQAAILRGLEQTRHLPIAVGLIAILQRTRPLPEATQVVDFVIDHKEEFIGLDLADDEVGFDPAPFAHEFRRAKKAGLHITVHSGEAAVLGSAERVRDAVELLGAERIGHGVQIYKSPQMIEFVRARKITLELCPTSNWLTQAVATRQQHPLRQLLQKGVSVTLNSDDPGVFDIDLSHEFQVAEDELLMSDSELDLISDIAAAASFIPLADKQRFWPRPIDPR